MHILSLLCRVQCIAIHIDFLTFCFCLTHCRVLPVWVGECVLLCFIDPRVRKITNKASSCPGIFSRTLRFYYVASSPGSPLPHLLDGHRKLVGCSAIPWFYPWNHPERWISQPIFVGVLWITLEHLLEIFMKLPIFDSSSLRTICVLLRGHNQLLVPSGWGKARKTSNYS